MATPTRPISPELLTGTPYGPVDFVLLDRATAEHLRTFGVLAVLGKAAIVKMETEAKLSEAARGGRKWSSARSTSSVGKETWSAGPSASPSRKAARRCRAG